MTAPTGRKVTPEMLAQMVALLPTIGSLRDLAGITGLRLDDVRREVAPFLAIMKLTGTHPQCGCGRDRFHPYGCVDSFAKASNDGWVPGHSMAESAILLAKRQTVIDAIMTGDAYSDIEKQLGMSKKTARAYLRFMTPEQVAQRKRLEKGRISRAASDKGEPKRPFSDPLYARLARAVPRWVTDATRDDIISEMYLAVTDGTLRPDDIEANAKRFATKAVEMWESRYGARSIDEPLFSDSSKTLADMIVDPSALAAFDHIVIGAGA